MHKRLVFTLSFVVIYATLFAQSTRVLNNLPPSIKWYQIKTEHFNIIYPQGFSIQGQRMANTMEHIYQPGSKSLGVEPKKNFPLILQNQTAVSNGFVTLGPRRSEFYTMSPQRANFLGNNDWLDLLAIHEYRHVVQYDRSRTGFTGFIRTIFGEYSQAGIAATSVPTWFWEGDAVGMETSLSASGRGRIPEFSAAFRANLLEKGPYNYNKQFLKSYKDFIPNHYVLGYHYATYLKNEYGSHAVEEMVNKAWALPFIPFTFSFAQKKYGGKKMPDMYLAMTEQLKKKWTEQQQSLEITPFNLVETKAKKVYTNYNYPQQLDNGNILVIKSGLGDYEQLVEVNIDTGEEEVKYTPGLVNDAGMLSVQGSMVVWNEYEFDPRWRQITYSVIRTYNLATDSYNELNAGTRYTSAALSPDRTRIATIEELADYSNRVVILDAYSGKVNKTIDAPSGSAYLTPIWVDNAKIVISEVREGAKQIKEINVEDAAERILLPPTTDQLSYAFERDGFLFYVSGWGGIDNVYAKDLSNEKVYQVTSSKYGAYNPTLSADGKIIYYNNLTVLGNDIVSVANDPGSWKLQDALPNTDIKFYQPMVELEDNAAILTTIPDVKYEETRHRKKLLKLHSWGPFITNSANELEAGLYSTNVLSTTDAFAGFRVDTEANFKWIGRVSYQSLYPIIDVEANYAHRNASVSLTDTTNALITDNRTWDELGVKAGVRFPWLLTRNKFHTNLVLQNYFGLTKVSNYQSSLFGQDRFFFFGRLTDGNLMNNELKVTFASLMKRSKRDIRSRFGITLVMESFITPYGGDFKGGLTALKSQVFFPGLVKHHSFNIFGGYQHNNITLDDNNYWFPNRMPYPRGVNGSTFEDFYTFRFNYDMPLLYPDLGLGPWLYFQRVKTEFFYDYGYGNSNVTNREANGGQGLQFVSSKAYYSTGVELTFDFNLMRALPVLELGVRYFYLPDLNQSGFEFLVGSFGF